MGEVPYYLSIVGEVPSYLSIVGEVPSYLSKVSPHPWPAYQIQWGKYLIIYQFWIFCVV